MIYETFVSSTQQRAYEQAVKKYGEPISVVRAKQLEHQDGSLRCEVVIAVAKERFMACSFGESLMRESREEVKRAFVARGISPAWLEGCLASLPPSRDRASLLQGVIEAMDRGIHLYPESLELPKVVMFVGMTGVGKSTALAKITARYTQHAGVRVALLNLDTQKAGAVEQLEQYATRLRVPVYAIDSIEAFEKQLEQLNTYDVVLVDSGGLSPYDTQRFMEIIGYRVALKGYRIETHLVIPATLKYEDMHDMYQHFSFLAIDALVVTKFDETKHFGAVLSFVLESSLALSYFSTGQAIPQDLRIADKEYLLEVSIGAIDEQ